MGCETFVQSLASPAAMRQRVLRTRAAYRCNCHCGKSGVDEPDVDP